MLSFHNILIKNYVSRIPYWPIRTFVILIPVFMYISCENQVNEKAAIEEYRKWHTITLNFEGPGTSEMAEENPFLNYRLNVNFSIGDRVYSHDTSNVFIKTYQPHIDDWKDGDVTWKNGKGKGIIGALNYLAGEKMNAVYFLTMNITADGKDVWPYVSQERFEIKWFDPLNGGPLKDGPQLFLEGAGWQGIDKVNDDQDWVALIRKSS